MPSKTITYIQINTPCPAELTTREEVKTCLKWAAKMYGLNEYNFIQTAHGESGFDVLAIGKAGEIGVFQYFPATFDLFSKLFDKHLPSYFTANIYSPRDQIILTAVSWSVADTEAARHWVAWRNLVRK